MREMAVCPRLRNWTCGRNPSESMRRGDFSLGNGFNASKQERDNNSEPAQRARLARLLELNHERYAEEVAQGLHEKKVKKGGKTKPDNPKQRELDYK